MEIALHISSNISGCTGPIFAIISPYESTLCVDDESVPYFPICQGALLWQPDIFTVMILTDTTSILCTCAKWQYCFVLLLFAVPSGLLARYCNAFLVSFFLLL